MTRKKFKCPKCGKTFEVTQEVTAKDQEKFGLSGMAIGALTGFIMGGPVGLCAGALTGGKGGKFLHRMAYDDVYCPRCHERVEGV